MTGYNPNGKVVVASDVTHQSGGQYAAAHLDDIKNVQKIPVARRNCGHLTSVCVDCYDQWATDYTFFLDNTGGGRRLKIRLEAAGKLQP